MSNDHDTTRTGPKAGDPDTTYHTRWDMVNKAKSGGNLGIDMTPPTTTACG